MKFTNELPCKRTRESISGRLIYPVYGIPQLLLRAAKGSFWLEDFCLAIKLQNVVVVEAISISSIESGTIF